MGEPWIDLSDVKAHLNKTTGVDDGELDGFIDAACGIIEDLKGHVLPTPFTQITNALVVSGVNYHRGYNYGYDPSYGFTSGYGYTPRQQYVIELTETPVLSVTAVTRRDWLDEGVDVTIPAADDPDGDGCGWTLHDCVLSVPSRGRYTVTYEAGLAAIPGNYRMAGLELVAHLWRASQLNQNSGRPAIGGDQMQVMPHLSSALPYRVRELLGIYGEIVNEHVVIA